MKIRTDFVTNSSSSSYVTIKLDNKDFEEYLKRNNIEKDYLNDLQFDDMNFYYYSEDLTGESFRIDNLKESIVDTLQKYIKSSYTKKTWKIKNYLDNHRDEIELNSVFDFTTRYIVTDGVGSFYGHLHVENGKGYIAKFEESKVTDFNGLEELNTCDDAKFDELAEKYSEKKEFEIVLKRKRRVEKKCVKYVLDGLCDKCPELSQLTNYNEEDYMWAYQPLFEKGVFNNIDDFYDCCNILKNKYKKVKKQEKLEAERILYEQMILEKEREKRESREYFSEPDSIVCKGLTFVTTFLDPSEEEWVKNEVTERGGYFRASISGKTNILIGKSRKSFGQKLQRAIELKKQGKDIQIITIKYFNKLLREGKIN